MTDSDSAVRPFEVRVEAARIDALRSRLADTRWPNQIPGTGWRMGSDVAYVRELCDYWRTGFDWRVAEARLNSWPNFITTIDGQLMHFIHVRSAEPEAIPLLLTHGWPGSVFEFMSIIGPLTDPVAYGGEPQDAFDVVCPSLPGYGWSGPTHEAGWDIRRIARAETELMDRLGYLKFGVQGGDWGASASVNIAAQSPQKIIGMHLNLVPTSIPTDADQPSTAEREEAERRAWFGRHEGAYSLLQGTKPLTLGYGLTDSPAGFAAWVVEKFRSWSDCDGDIEASFSKDELLSHISSYWFTDTVASSIRLYYETHTNGVGSLPPEFINVPTGCAIFPAEIMKPPRSWAERHYNIVHWSELGSGGHFAAAEEPEAFVADVRQFFRPLRAKERA